ncbi:MAG: tetraacyldisaccharide 4'-kinase [candidate division NC10 bacterium]|nr:tetraacyldisaccharide 4'-kinase [candidate division NC10 bacterium]
MFGMRVPAWLGRRVEEAIAGEAPGVPCRVARLLLAGLAGLYGAGMGLRNVAYDRGLLRIRRLPCRVICVGNLTVGGTGKTPTVLWLARALASTGRRVAVVLRGYGSQAGAASRVVSDGGGLQEDWRSVGDEAALLAARLPGIPVLIGGDRYAAGLLALSAFQAEVIVLDDGFQHRRLHRDVDLVLVDATDPFGGGWLLPRGRLRERPTNLGRAHALLLTRADEGEVTASLRERLERLAPGVPVASAIHKPSALLPLPDGPAERLEALRGSRVLAVSGIANPGSFRRGLEALGMEVAAHLAYPDHHPYGAAERAEIDRSARSRGARAIVTTEKDAVRLGTHLPAELPVYAVRIDLEVVAGGEAIGGVLGVDLGDQTRG